MPGIFAPLDLVQAGAEAGPAAFLALALRTTTPILLAALGVLVSTRAGVMNVGVEGAMLSGAFAGVVVSALSGSAWLGLAAALAAGMLTGAILALAVEWLRADLVVSGIAVNLCAASATSLCLFALTGDKGMSGSLASRTLPLLPLSFVSSVPVLSALANQHVLTWAAYVAVPLTSLLLFRTPFGLRLRVAGESGLAAVAAGLRAGRLRLAALVISGALAAAGGAYLSMGQVGWFAVNMSAGRGYLAVAAAVLGGTPLGVLAASLMLGASGALAIALQGTGLANELLQAVPYLLPVIVLVLHALGRRKIARAV